MTQLTNAGQWLSDHIGHGYCEGWTVTVRDEFIASVEEEAAERQKASIAGDVLNLAERLARRHQAVGQDWPQPVETVRIPVAALLDILGVPHE